VLRADNADERLTPVATDLGLSGQARREIFRHRMAELTRAREVASALLLSSSAAAKLGLKVNQDGSRRTALQLMVLPDVGFDRVAEIWPELRAFSESTRDALQADALYAGYADRQRRDIAKAEEEKGRVLPADLDYAAIPGLSLELRQKLAKVRPATLAHADRIDGMTPAAIACIISAARNHSRAGVA
jgi:tRNA uridine 5-carboxymethylaminomethyl modification enzyme